MIFARNDNLIREKTKGGVVFDESRPNKKLLRKEYIQQKGKRTLDMALFTYMSGVQFLDLC